MHKWTDEDHELVKILTAQGLTVAQIALETGLTPGGIKRSRVVNRLTATKSESTTQQAGAEGSEVLRLRVQLEQLQQELLQLRAQLEPLQKDFEIRERARLRRLEEQESENPGGLKLNIRR